MAWRKARWLSLSLAFACQGPRAVRLPSNISEVSVPTTPSSRNATPESPSAPRAPANGLPGVTASCESGATVVHGRFVYANNTWGEGKTTAQFQQCVLTRLVDGKTVHGWSWAWPGLEPLGFGFPEVVFGWKPWFAGSTDPALPIRLGALHGLTVRYAVATESAGPSPLALAAWLTNTDATEAANPRAIVGEVVVWLTSRSDVVPPGSLSGRVQVAGIPYELWHAPNHGDRGDGQGWPLYCFRGPPYRDRDNVDLAAFLSFLFEAKHTSREYFLASVELGNEIFGGSGTTWVEAFDVQVVPTP